jgi:hypothetical protein
MDLTPAAWDFLADVARSWGMSWARVLRDEMGSGFIAELDEEPVLECEEPADFISTKVTPTHSQGALL